MDSWIVQGTVLVGDDPIWQEILKNPTFITEEACTAFINSTDAAWQHSQQYVYHIADMFHGVAYFTCILANSI